MKMEDDFSFSDYFFSSSTSREEDQETHNNSLGFKDLLALQDFGPFLFQDDHDYNIMSSTTLEADNIVSMPKMEISLNLQPNTPNTSSISSISNELDLHGKLVDEEEGNQEEMLNQRTKKGLKAKKTNNQKKQREARFAFMTKSEVDHLEDGYRWRKYGQKAVKNSPFPRSYYRCTSAACGVKKRVERSCNDPTIVMTTYEGQHTHLSPITPRGSHNNSHIFPTDHHAISNTFTMPITQNMTISQLHHQQQQQQSLIHHLSSSRNFDHGGAQNHGFMKDYGLLEDIVPSFMPKEEKK